MCVRANGGESESSRWPYKYIRVWPAKFENVTILLLYIQVFEDVQKNNFYNKNMFWKTESVLVKALTGVIPVEMILLMLSAGPIVPRWSFFVQLDGTVHRLHSPVGTAWKGAKGVTADTWEQY